MWFIRKKSKTPVLMHVPKVEFLAEQEGETESILKAALIMCFQRHATVRKAYLVQTIMHNKSTVALCLIADVEGDQDLLRGIGDVFHKIFRPEQFLDIVFANAKQHEELECVSSPFYISA